ncbi:CpaF family protein [Novosphingobium album (ex Liu et al. 2023)]|uniref:CpaF family protein n=1 Tax=Novosphingobium album (ex Liu et al. 2023) TaxID=3031130 RepID=A0ABT5WLB0_9SPHN|nr:CpaF family protein [Novosphingobium album (ex Liu et al. 2023)]MDE8650501.1 CpaF family protein [Novosphingobium album (ex Liu et al. 2023)]
MSLLTTDALTGEDGGEGRRSKAAIAQPSAQRMSDSYQAVKALTCQQVIDQLEAQGVTAESLDQRTLRQEIEQVISSRSRRGQQALNSAERLLLIEDVEDEVVGLGPLAPLLRDPTVDDIIVNGASTIYAERAGLLERVETRFRDDTHLMHIIQRIVGPIGRRVDEATPFVDARLPDGSRVNIVIPPIALDGPLISIRKFRMQALSLEDCVASRLMSAAMAAYLSAAVRSRLNLVICGGTGSGKSTLLNVLSSCISNRERLVTIEDAAELQLRQDHVVRLETRPPNVDGNREVSSRDLLRNALRMRPDRIILGEVRGVEAVEMLQAMSTGHDGSMATLHGNSPRDALARLEMLLGFAGQQNDVRAVRRFVANSVHVIVNIQRLSNGSRRVVSVTEVTGVEGEAYTLNELFRFDEQPAMSGQGEFRTISPRPYHAARLRDYAPLTREAEPW